MNMDQTIVSGNKPSPASSYTPVINQTPTRLDYNEEFI